MNFNTTKLLINLFFKFVIGVLAYQLFSYILLHVDIKTFVAVWISLEVGLKSAVTFRE